MKVGDTLGPYEIREPLGAGGMGEVWLAVDSRLGRRVAIKVLPEAMARDPAALRRFETEARAVAALSHPGILEIHDVGTAGERAYVVTELLEGESLDKVLADGPMPTRKAIDTARQVALALAAAHERGIIHRDVKPSNVFLTRDGRVKLLDFGLARATPEGSATDTKVATVAGTQPGVVMGTVGYMSPEQVRGEVADARSDIFSLGATLHEMLMGESPFRRPTPAETMTAILREDLPEPAPGRPPLPPATERVLRRCLEKLPLERFQTARDLAFALETAPLSGPKEIASVTRDQEARGAWLPAWVAGVAMILVGALAGIGLARWMAPAVDLEPPRVRQLTFTGTDSEPAASPDGRLVAFASARDGVSRIWLRQMVGGGEQPISDGTDHLPRISPDGNTVLFTRVADTGLAVYRSGLVGGQARLVVDDAHDADWSPDGESIAYLRVTSEGTQLRLRDLQSGQERQLQLVANYEVGAPRFSPDGTTIALVVSPLIFGATGAYMLLVDVADGSSRQLPTQPGDQGLSGAAWTADSGNLIYGVSTSPAGDRSGMPSRIVLQPRDGSERRTLLWVTGLFPPRGTFSQLGRVELLDGGSLLLSTGTSTQSLHEVAIADGPGQLGRRLTAGEAQDRQPVYSPDGRYVMFSSNRSGNLDLWRLELASGALLQLTDDPAQDWDPAFMPDGESIIWSSDRSGNLEIWTATAVGAEARQVSHNGADAQNPTATPDGQWIVYTSGNPAAPGLYRVREDGTEEAPIVTATGLTLALPELSPDGDWVMTSVTAGEDGRRHLRAYAVADGRPSEFNVEFELSDVALTIIFGRSRWLSPRTIAYVDHDGAGTTGIYVQEFLPEADTRATRRALAGFIRGEVVESFAFSPHGRSIVMAVERSSRSLVLAEGLNLR